MEGLSINLVCPKCGSDRFGIDGDCFVCTVCGVPSSPEKMSARVRSCDDASYFRLVDRDENGDCEVYVKFNRPIHYSAVVLFQHLLLEAKDTLAKDGKLSGIDAAAREALDRFNEAPYAKRNHVKGIISLIPCDGVIDLRGTRGGSIVSRPAS